MQTALYLRLSRDDEATPESMSIANQRAFLQHFAAQKNWPVAQEYVDDGYSGTHFQRPAFQRLLTDIEQGKIDTVLTKDLSRLGRDQIGTLYYIQIYFPAHHVRYLAVADGFDSWQDSNLMTPFLAAANDFYTADISRKVRAALDTRKQNGLFIGSQAPIGYRKDPARKGHLVPDPETAWIIPLIFQLFLQSGSVSGTAKYLTEHEIPPPSAWKAQSNSTRFPGVWSDTMIRRILSNPTYAGHLTQNRRRKVSYKSNQRSILSPKDWITVFHTHPPLVSQADFDQVQQLLSVRSYRSARPEASSLACPSPPHLFTGLAFCADCGSPMCRVHEGNHISLICQRYRKGGRLHLCTPHRVRETTLLVTIQAELQALVQRIDPDQFLPPAALQTRQKRLLHDLARLQQQKEQNHQVQSALYADRVSGKLLEKEFGALFAETRQKESALEKQIAACSQTLHQTGDWKHLLASLLRFAPLDRGTLHTLIQKIQIGPQQQIDLFFRFQEPPLSAGGDP